MPRRELLTGSPGRAVAAVGVVAAALLACGRQAEPPRPSPPSVILVSVDTLRADHLGCYGYPRPTSPFIDSLAAEGVLFENAFAQASWTLPSHMSLFTSRYPQTHQVETDRRALPPGVTTLAGTLRDHGYATHAYVSWFYVAAAFGFDRGFDRFVELLPPPEQWDDSTHHSIKAAGFADAVAAGVGDLAHPFFLFLHLFDPHMDYEPPLEHARRFDPRLGDVRIGRYAHLARYIRGLPGARRVPPDELAEATALYDGEIRYVDAELERLFGVFEAAGLLEGALVVFTSDHGEELDDHGSMEGHQWTLYDEVLRVPLIVRSADGGRAGERVVTVVQSVDIAPAILDLLHVPVPEEFEGRSLAPLVRGEPAPSGGGFAFARIARFNHRWAVRTARHKLIHTAGGASPIGVRSAEGFELYDLVADPGERTNLYRQDSPVVRELVELLRRSVPPNRPLVPVEPPEIRPEDRERLEALGYLDG